MNNRKTLTLIHDAASDYGKQYYQDHKDWKKDYNAKYYREHKDYWVDYYKRAGVKGKIDLERMSDESNPEYRRKLAKDAIKRGDLVEAVKQANRAAIEQDVRNMHEAVASGDRARRQAEAERSRTSGQANAGAKTPMSGKKELAIQQYLDKNTGHVRNREYTQYSANQAQYYIGMAKRKANELGSNWKSGAKDIISTGKSIVSGLRSKLGF